MSDDDRRRWDERYAGTGPRNGRTPKAVLVDAAPWLPLDGGRALDLACGEGQASLFLATRSLDVDAVDVSPVAIETLRELAAEIGVEARIRPIAADLDDGLPDELAGTTYDVIVCLHFRSPLLAQLLANNLCPGGVVVASRLSVVGRDDPPGSGADPRFLAAPGELAALVATGFDVLRHEEADGEAVLVARRHS